MKNAGALLEIDLKRKTSFFMENGSKKARVTQGLALTQETWDKLALISENMNRSRNNLIETSLLDLIQNFKAKNPEVAKKLNI